MPQGKTKKKRKTTGVAATPDVAAATPVVAEVPAALRLEWMDPATLTANPRNWRRHPDNQKSALRAALSEVGWAGALLYNEKTSRLIDGHARQDLKREPGEKVPVLVGSWTEAQEGVILASLDPLAAMAEADQPVLDALLKTVHVQDPALDAMLAALKTQTPPPILGDTDAELIDDDDNPEAEFLAPFPWFGGKSRVAGYVWKCLGDVKNYTEPFFGSGAVLLRRPQPFDGIETVNDADGLLANFWRAVQSDPEKVAEYADWPVNENDLHARHIWLTERKETLQAKLEGDPDYFDAKTAGWWCWGMACWIGSGFCSGNGPWGVREVDGERKLVHLGDAGQGVNRQLVHLGDAGRGVNRKLVHLGNAGQGVNRKRVHLGNAGQEKPGNGSCGLMAWIKALAERIKRVRVCCGDWTRICGGDSGDALKLFFASGPTCGVFLDPPYADTAKRTSDLYRKDSGDIAHDVREWAIKHGDDERLRICLAGYEGEHKMPSTWRYIGWKAAGGYESQSTSSENTGNCRKERLWFSPHCVQIAKAA